MNLRDLQYLVALSDSKHFGKAAELCFVSQPALSMQLKKLETQLGVQLFERTNKSVMITSIGQDIANRARKILQDAAEIKAVAKAHQNPLIGDLKLGVFPTLAPYFLPKIIPTINESLPDLKLLLIEEKTDILLKKLQNGQVDIAVLALPLPLEITTLEYTKLFEDDFLLAVAPSHKFAMHKSIARADLENEILLLLDDGHCMRNQALDICSLSGAKENQEFRATSLETLRAMVAVNVGITLIPKLAKQHNDGIVYIPFEPKPPTREIVLVWRKSSSRKKLFNKMAVECMQIG